MSIVESLRRLVDPVEKRNQELRRKAEREQPEREASGDPPSERQDVAPTPQYRCRVCGHTGDDKSYCPECLADTMRKV